MYFKSVSLLNLKFTAITASINMPVSLINIFETMNDYYCMGLHQTICAVRKVNCDHTIFVHIYKFFKENIDLLCSSSFKALQ